MFNPQIDIYTFLKHFREDFTVLTSPPTLHLYHRGGFPRITGFKDGERIINEIMCPYEDKLRKLAPTIWPGETLDVRPTAPLHMARFFIDENESHYGLHVCTDGDQESFDKHTEWSKKTEAYRVKYEMDLTRADLKKNLLLQGKTDQFRLEFLEGKKTPLKITSDKIQIGPYEFPKSEVALFACFPNPYQEEKYIMIKIIGSKLKSIVYENHVDYLICRNNEDGKAEVLLHGFFDKSEKG